jgi:hypothetical protein
VYAGSRIVRVRCPPDTKTGQSLQITVPIDPNPNGSDPKLPPDSSNVRRISDSNPPAFMVAITDAIRSGQQFPVTIQGQQLMVTCPPNARPGMSVRIVPLPPPSDVTGGPATDAPMGVPPKPKPEEKEKTQLFEVEVPRGVQPGAPFALLAGGVLVLVTCRRQYLLGDSVDAVMSLSRKDLRKLWRFEFIGEMGIRSSSSIDGPIGVTFRIIYCKLFGMLLGLALRKTLEVTAVFSPKRNIWINIRNIILNN